MTPHQLKLKTLVDRLTKKTTEGELSWKSRISGSASVSLDTGIVEVKKDFDSEGQDAVRITIYDHSGDLKASFDDTELTTNNVHGSSVHYYLEMKSLLDAALRSARGEDQVINQLLSELDDEVPF